MRKPQSMRALEDLGRVRLSRNFFLRDFLYSEIAGFYGIPNIPFDPGAAILAGRRLCEELLEPLQATFGRLGLRSGYRAPEVTEFGNKRRECGSVETNAAYHIWDMRDEHGRMGAAACLVIRGSPTNMKTARTGEGSPGGSTIICPMRIWSSTRSFAPSIFSGAKPLNDASTASSILKDA